MIIPVPELKSGGVQVPLASDHVSMKANLIQCYYLREYLEYLNKYSGVPNKRACSHQKKMVIFHPARPILLHNKTEKTFSPSCGQGIRI